MLPTAVLETRGARTGAVRRNALIYFHDGDDVIVMAAHVGLPTHPGWFHNLVATPEVTFGGEPFRASVVDADRRPPVGRGRPRLPAVRPLPAARPQSGRTIPLVRLTPRS